MCTYPFFGAEDPGLFGLNVSALVMQGDNLASGWFKNSAGGTLRIASGAWVDTMSGTTLDIVKPYQTNAGECESIGFNAYGECGEVSAFSGSPTEVLTPNQLGRLWHPCDAVTSPVPSSCM